MPACVGSPAAGSLLSLPRAAAAMPAPPRPAAPAPQRSQMTGCSPPAGLSDATHYGSCSSLASCQATANGGAALPMAPPSDRGDNKRPAAHDGAGAAHGGKRAVPAGGPSSATPSPNAQHAMVAAAPQPAPLALPAAALAGRAKPGVAAATGALAQALPQPQPQAHAAQLAQGGYYYAAAPQPLAYHEGWAVAQHPYIYAPAAAAAAPAAASAAGGQHIAVTCNGLLGYLDIGDMLITVGPAGGTHAVRGRLGPRAAACPGWPALGARTRWPHLLGPCSCH